jgi:hypothetical protein
MIPEASENSNESENDTAKNSKSSERVHQVVHSFLPFYSQSDSILIFMAGFCVGAGVMLVGLRHLNSCNTKKS